MKETILWLLTAAPVACLQCGARPLSGSVPLASRRSTLCTSSLGAAPLSAAVGDALPTLSLSAPAKINLFLRILRRRQDGFHELSSLFQAVSLMDTLDFWQLTEAEGEPICSMEVTANSLGAELIPTDDTNLVMRALQLFADRTGERRRVHCRLHKAVPAQGGLGGGSSDAATALHAANRLAGFPVAEEELIRWGGELGSDVGFFLSRGTAMCTGRGELIEPLPPLPPCIVYLVKPAEGLSTPAVFKTLGLKPDETLAGLEPSELLSRFQRDVTSASFVNDLEAPAYEVMPRLQQLRDELRTYGFDAVMMSGSGSTIFCVGEPRDEVRATWQQSVRDAYGASVYEEAFCTRPADEQLWYGEAPDKGAETETEVEEAPATALGGEQALPSVAAPDGFTWGLTF